MIGRGHSVDLGLAQINNANLAGLGLSIAGAFEPCSNLAAAQAILGGSYQRANAAFGPGQFALRRALGAYNTGSLYAGADYADRVFAAASGTEVRAVRRGRTLRVVPVHERAAAASVARVLPQDAPILVLAPPVLWAQR